jgi:hypothetical protein
MSRKYLRTLIVLGSTLAIFTFSGAGMESQSACEGKKYEITFLISAATRMQREAEIRQLISSGFNDRRRLCAEVTWFTKEGDPNAYTYHIEPNDKGEWVIGIEVTREMYPRGRGSHSKKRTVHGHYVATRLNFVPLAQGSSDSHSSSANDIDHFKGLKMQLVDQNGEVIQEI